MSASADRKANRSLHRAQRSRVVMQAAEATHRDDYLRYVRDARSAAWSYERIGEGLAISGVAVRRFWTRHRYRAGRLADA